MGELDDEEPRPPRPPVGRPGQPLPRLRYSLPPQDDDETAAPDEPAPGPSKRGARGADQASSRSRSQSPGTDPASSARSTPPPSPPGRPGGPTRAPAGSSAADAEASTSRRRVLREETPELDTYAARQNARRVVGGIAAVALLISLLFILLRVGGSGNPSPYVDDDEELALADSGGPPPAAVPPRPGSSSRSSTLEREAQIALADARRFAEQGHADLTLRKLQAVVSGYPKTKAAAQAQEALDRSQQGLPLFVDSALVVAEKSEPPPDPPAAEPPAVVVAQPPVPVGPATSEVELTPPAVPVEPHRPTGLVRETAEIAPRSLPVGFRPRPEAGVHPSGWPLEITCDHDGATLVYVPVGTFLAGRNDGEPQERPAHRATLSPFYIDQHEVTRRQFALFLQATGRSPALSGGGEAQPDNLPATQVSFAEALAYTEWAGRTLPTEAQWEFAARTTDGRLHPWGAASPHWANPRQPGQIDPVMSYELDLSPYGVFDLAGNAREWTLDFFRYYEPQPSGAEPPLNPVVTQPGRQRTHVVKGGAPDWSASWRVGLSPASQMPDVGFRGALNLPGAEVPRPATAAASPAPSAAPPPAASSTPEPQPPPARPQFPGGAVPF